MLRYNPGMLVVEMAARVVPLGWTKMAIDLVPLRLAQRLAQRLEERGSLW